MLIVFFMQSTNIQREENTKSHIVSVSNWSSKFWKWYFVGSADIEKEENSGLHIVNFQFYRYLRRYKTIKKNTHVTICANQKRILFQSVTFFLARFNSEQVIQLCLFVFWI